MGMETWDVFYGLFHLLGTAAKSEFVVVILLVALEAGIFKKTLDDIEER